MLLYNLERFGGGGGGSGILEMWNIGSGDEEALPKTLKPGNLCFNRDVIRGRTVGVCINDARSASTPAWPCLSPQRLVRVSGSDPIRTTVENSPNSGNRSCRGQPVKWQTRKACLQLPPPANSRRTGAWMKFESVWRCYRLRQAASREQDVWKDKSTFLPLLLV